MIVLTSAATLSVGFVGSAEASSTLEYDEDVTPDVIFGTGNDNGSFTVNRDNGLELGLRGKLRFNSDNDPENTFNSNGDGTYSFAAGTPPSGFSFAPTSTTPIWNFEWSINSDYQPTGKTLSSYDYQLDIDFDAGIGQNFQSFDPINTLYADHAIGNNATGNGGGSVAPFSDTATYSNLIANNNVAQNSWSMEFFNNGPFDIFDPTVDGTYDFRLTAFEKGTQTKLAQTEMQIIVGQGATDVPEPASLLGLATIGAVAAGGALKKKAAA